MSYQYLGEKNVKARKRHQCFICGGSIWPGTKYRRSHHIYDSGPYQIKEHVECARVASKYCGDSFDYPDGYQGEDVQTAMEEAHGWKGVYQTGDFSRDERIVWSRFRQAWARYMIGRVLA